MTNEQWISETLRMLAEERRYNYEHNRDATIHDLKVELAELIQWDAMCSLPIGWE